MEKTATLNLRVNPVIKQNAEQVLKQLGIPMATAVDMFLRQVSLPRVFRLNLKSQWLRVTLFLMENHLMR